MDLLCDVRFPTVRIQNLSELPPLDAQHKLASLSSTAAGGDCSTSQSSPARRLSDHFPRLLVGEATAGGPSHLTAGR